MEATPSAKLLQSEKHQATIRRLQGLREANIGASREAGAGLGGEGGEISGEAGGNEPRRTGRSETPFRSGGVAKPPSGVYLIRHGCTTLNEQSSKQSPDVIRGHVDVPLDKKGHTQAAKLGEDLAGKDIEVVFSSDLSRSMHTGAPVAHSNGAPLIAVFGLRPWDLGKIQGKPTNEVQPQIDYLIDHADERAPDGESCNEFKNRFLSTVRDIVNASKGKRIAVITHYRGVKLLGSLDKNGEVDNDEFKRKDGALEPGGCQFFDLPETNKPMKGIQNA
jgi:broad specificity phosphatase PhoE